MDLTTPVLKNIFNRFRKDAISLQSSSLSWTLTQHSLVILLLIDAWSHRSGARRACGAVRSNRLGHADAAGGHADRRASGPEFGSFAWRLSDIFAGVRAAR